MPKKEGYIAPESGEVVDGSGNLVKNLSDKVAESESRDIQIPRKFLQKLSLLEPEKQERYLSKLLKEHQSKNVRVSVNKLEEALHYLKHTRGYHPSLVEDLLQRDIDYGNPQLKRMVQGIAHRAEEAKGQYIKLPRKDLLKVAKLAPEKQEEKLKDYLTKDQGKYVEVSREQLIDALEHLQAEKRKYMSPLERLAYRGTALLLVMIAVGLIGAPTITGFAVSSAVWPWSVRIPFAMLSLLTAGYLFVRK